MIPSRQQAAQGPYGPLLTAGLYPTGPAAAAPVAASTAPQSGGSMAPVPAAPVSAANPGGPAPVSVGSLDMDGDPNGESAPSTPSPDQSFGGVMGALSTAASIGLGGPFGFAGALGALGLSNALGQPLSFNMTDVLSGLTAPSTQDLTEAGLSNAPAGTGATVSTGGLEPAGPDGKSGDAMGGSKGADKGDMGPDGSISGPGDVGSKGEPGTAPNGGEKGDGDSGPGGPGPGGEGGTGVGGEPGDGGVYMEGGYTGAGDDGVVDPAAEAGTVHEGEVVIPADMVKHYGLDLLMGLVSGEVPKNRLAQIAGMR